MAVFQNDDELLKALKRGEESAFNEIYDRFWYKLFLVAYQRIRKKEVSQELVQNLFMKLWEKRESLTIRVLESYLYGSMKYAVIDYINAQVVANNYIEYCSFLLNTEEKTTERMVAFSDVTEAMENGLTQLPDKSQQVFRLNRLNHWPIDKIANHLNLSEKTVQYHLTKSLKFLRTYLKEFTFSLFLYLFR